MEKKEKLKQEKLNQGSRKVVNNDLNGNQLFKKEMEKYEIQVKKQEIREEKQLKKQETLIRRKTEDAPNSGNSGCCCSGDPCSGCDDECVDLVIMILCFPAHRP